MHIHILGICGTFMGSLALLAREAGHRVTGCDAGVYPPMSTQLANAGIELVEGWDAAQLAIKPDVFVIGNVVSRGNPLMEAILNAGLRYTSGPQWLADHTLPGRPVLAVAGTHGKTTTTALLAWILDQAGLEPGFLIGGVPLGWQGSARLGRASAPFVIEADEYDTAFFDKRSKFVHYRPRVAILNNLEYDHADIFPDLAAIQTQFHHLVRTVPGEGTLVLPAHDTALDAVLARGCWSQVVRVGSGAELALDHDGPDACVLVRQQPAGVLRLPMPGRHNRHNALAAMAAARTQGVSIEQSLAALASFPGVRRRTELRGEVRDIAVFDDFAHHPTAIATTIDGLRERYPGRRLLAVLEPRSNTMKQGVIKDQLAISLARADRVWCFGAREGKHALGWDPATTLAPLGERARSLDDLDTLVRDVVAAARPGDLILVMSNGGFGGIHEKLLDGLKVLA
jgi:UDP-N-acetylmuramate: L-alanyl-gamma-D-glutamyl-meso-diaminopimelate ligase